MELYRPWTDFLLVLLALAQIGGLAALVRVCLRRNRRSREGNQRPIAPVREVTAPFGEVVVRPRSPTALVVGPSEPIVVRPALGESLVIGPSSEPLILIHPERFVTVEPLPRGAWDDRGWVKRSENGQEIYEGFYQVADRRSGQSRRFRGVVVVRGGEIVPYIADPPAELRRHPKHPCFQLCGPPWFKIHWHHAAGNVDDAILYLERVLDEAINRRRVARS